jgi:hypothetical protein
MLIVFKKRVLLLCVMLRWDVYAMEALFLSPHSHKTLLALAAMCWSAATTDVTFDFCDALSEFMFLKTLQYSDYIICNFLQLVSSGCHSTNE